MAYINVTNILIYIDRKWVFADAIKVRVKSSWLRVGLTSNESALIRDRKGQRRRRGEDTGRVWCDAPTRQGPPVITRRHQKLEEARKGSPLGHQMERGPAGALVKDF